jgi:hypothetical protein
VPEEDSEGQKVVRPSPADEGRDRGRRTCQKGGAGRWVDGPAGGRGSWLLDPVRRRPGTLAPDASSRRLKSYNPDPTTILFADYRRSQGPDAVNPNPRRVNPEPPPASPRRRHRRRRLHLGEAGRPLLYRIGPTTSRPRAAAAVASPPCPPLDLRREFLFSVIFSRHGPSGHQPSSAALQPLIPFFLQHLHRHFYNHFV